MSSVTFPACGCFPACLSCGRHGGSSCWVLAVSVRGWQREQRAAPDPLALPLGFPSVWQEIHQAHGEGFGGLQWLP